MSTFTPSERDKAILEDLKKVIDADRTPEGTSRDIDPGDEQDWFSLTLGFFLAKGLTAEEAHDLSRHVRYQLHYWYA
jgi:hypothetical protein